MAIQEFWAIFMAFINTHNVILRIILTLILALAAVFGTRPVPRPDRKAARKTAALYAGMAAHFCLTVFPVRWCCSFAPS